LAAGRPVAIQIVDEVLAHLDERGLLVQLTLVLLPIGRVQVFDHVNSIFRHPWIEELEGREGITHLMAAVVEYDIGSSKLVKTAL
jgi:hypothetical protein